MSKFPLKRELDELLVVKPGDEELRETILATYGFDSYEPDLVALMERIADKYFALIESGGNPEDWSLAIGTNLIKPEWEKVYVWDQMYVAGYTLKIIKVPVEGAIEFVRPMPKSETP